MSDHISLRESGEGEDGRWEIKDGRLIVTDPLGEGLPVVVVPHQRAEIKVNDQIVNAPLRVASSDRVEIVPLVEEIPGYIEVIIDEGGMQASVRVMPRQVKKMKLKDTAGWQELELFFEEDEVSETGEVTEEDINAALREKGVVSGINSFLVKKAVKKAGKEWEVVARGKEMKKGRDGYVELFFNPSTRISSYDDSDLARVDYKEKVVIPSVKEGDKLAYIHPPVPGEPGQLVTGEVIEPPPVHEVAVVCKEGCELDGEGSVLATSAGRPAAEGKHNEKIRVVPLYVHSGDVDLKSGNLRFKGAIRVTGDILEGMTVESHGDLEVLGNTAGAEIIAGGRAIFNKNVINSTVASGILKDLYAKLLPYLQEIEVIVTAMTEGIEQLGETLVSKGKQLGEQEMMRLSKLIAQKKYSNLPDLVKEALGVCGKAKFPPPANIAGTMEEIGRFLRQLEGEGVLSDYLKELDEDIKSAIAFLEKGQKMPGDVVANYVQNCRVQSGGNIIIKGAGCYNSQFSAGGDVHIKGVFRGGEIRAAGNVDIGEAGSPGLLMKQGRIYLAAGSIARFQKIYENVQLFFGKRSYKFSEDRGSVKVYYSPPPEDSVKIVHI